LGAEKKEIRAKFFGSATAVSENMIKTKAKVEGKGVKKESSFFRVFAGFCEKVPKIA